MTISNEALKVLASFPNKYLAYENDQNVGFEEQQKNWEEACNDSFDQCIGYEQMRIGSALIEKCIPKKAADRLCILHFHGGGFVTGSIATYRKFCSVLAKKTGFQVWNVGYTLATREKYPYQESEIAEISKYIASRNMAVIIGGDSSGGALALAAANIMREEKIEKPRLLYLLSPWLDLTLSGKSMQELDAIDPLVLEKDLARNASIYCDAGDLEKASPLFKDVAHDYPVHIDVGGREILLDDSRRLYEIIRKEHEDIKLIIKDGMWHTYQLWFNGLPETDEAINELTNSILQAG